MQPDFALTTAEGELGAISGSRLVANPLRRTKMKNKIRKVSMAVRGVLMGSLLLASIACSMLSQLSGIKQPPPMSVAGNWQIDLMDSTGNVGAVATGFLQQSGSNLTGGFDVNGCG